MGQDFMHHSNLASLLIYSYLGVMHWPVDFLGVLSVYIVGNTRHGTWGMGLGNNRRDDYEGVEKRSFWGPRKKKGGGRFHLEENSPERLDLWLYIYKLGRSKKEKKRTLKIFHTFTWDRNSSPENSYNQRRR